VVLPVSLRAVSRSLELSLQSPLQLSLTVLVSYRTRGCILVLEGVYLPLWAALPSNPTLGETAIPAEALPKQRDRVRRTGLSSSTEVGPDQRDSNERDAGTLPFP